MHWKFIHLHPDPMREGKTLRYLHRHPVIRVRAGMWPELKKLAKKKGYRNVNELIEAESQTLLMNLFLEATEESE